MFGWAVSTFICTARHAGHGVAVLLEIYAHCIDGQADAANRRSTGALGPRTPSPNPAMSKTGAASRHPEKRQVKAISAGAGT